MKKKKKLIGIFDNINDVLNCEDNYPCRLYIPMVYKIHKKVYKDEYDDYDIRIKDVTRIKLGKFFANYNRCEKETNLMLKSIYKGIIKGEIKILHIKNFDKKYVRLIDDYIEYRYGFDSIILLAVSNIDSIKVIDKNTIDYCGFTISKVNNKWQITNYDGGSYGEWHYITEEEVVDQELYQVFDDVAREILAKFDESTPIMKIVDYINKHYPPVFDWSTYAYFESKK